jgi:hypothetical protein
VRDDLDPQRSQAALQRGEQLGPRRVVLDANVDAYRRRPTITSTSTTIRSTTRIVQSISGPNVNHEDADGEQDQRE